MDFINRAAEKLDVKDKLPDQAKDKLGGPSSKGAKGEGANLASSNRGGGFPDGVRPDHWMGDLVKKNLVPETAAVTEFRYPGSHDCATYGSGAASFSYQCQDKTLYEQMKTGQRFFDLRLAQAENGKKFIPVHGVAKNTADDFNDGEGKAKPNDLASQILKFAKEHPTEILIFQVRVEDQNTGDKKKDFGDAVWNLLGTRLLAAPKQGTPAPKYNDAVKSNRNIIWALPGTFEGPIGEYVWNVGRETACWIGAGDGKLWNEPVWQSGELKKVLESTEEFIKQNEGKLEPRNKFWVANLQLTPVLGQSISTFISSGGSVRPRDLALGGGMGTHGSFKGSNKELQESDKLRSPLWKKTISCIVYDFCDTHTTGEIVKLNVDGHFPSGGAGGGSAAAPNVGPGAGDHDKPGKHAGRGAGRGQDDDDDDNDGPGGRGGRGRGRGRGRGGHD